MDLLPFTRCGRREDLQVYARQFTIGGFTAKTCEKFGATLERFEAFATIEAFEGLENLHLEKSRSPNRRLRREGRESAEERQRVRCGWSGSEPAPATAEAVAALVLVPSERHNDGAYVIGGPVVVRLLHHGHRCEL